MKTFGLVSPYTDEIQDRIIANYGTHGWQCLGNWRLHITENFASATVPEAKIDQLCREIASLRPDAIVVYCTNMVGARIAAQIEQNTGVPVLESTAAALWTSIRTASADPAQIKGWGSLFES